MPSIYHLDHLHLVSKDPQATARYFREMFDANVAESLSAEGKPRIDVELDGLAIISGIQADLSCTPQ